MDWGFPLTDRVGVGGRLDADVQFTACSVGVPFAASTARTSFHTRTPKRCVPNMCDKVIVNIWDEWKFVFINMNDRGGERARVERLIVRFVFVQGRIIREMTYEAVLIKL
jgi:hypothetical protein